jgi:hypothetical protein
VKTWPILLLGATLLPACGARTGLDAPPDVLVVAGTPPAYCQDAGDTAIYVVTDGSQLFRFDPPGAAFTPVGTLDCPVTASGQGPFSMAVDHQGTAYVVFGDGEMFTVSTQTAACAPTSAPVDSGNFTQTFGMGFSADPGGQSETLYLAGTGSPGQLGTLDTSSFMIENAGVFSTDIGETELTGTGAGQLFGFGVGSGVAGANLAAIDKQGAVILSDLVVPTPPNPTGWAFAFWGGDFYFFTGLGGDSSVGRFRPTDGSFVASYATLPMSNIVGAGVSTCAPR